MVWLAASKLDQGHYTCLKIYLNTFVTIKDNVLVLPIHFFWFWGFLASFFTYHTKLEYLFLNELFIWKKHPVKPSKEYCRVTRSNFQGRQEEQNHTIPRD